MGETNFLGAVSATTVTIPQEMRAALSYSACSFMFVMMGSVEWSLQLTFSQLIALACCAVEARSCNLDVGELSPCILHSGLLSVDSICNLLFLIDGAVESEGWPWDVSTSTKDAIFCNVCSLAAIIKFVQLPLCSSLQTVMPVLQMTGKFSGKLI